MTGTLNIGMIGNCSFAALIDPRARIVWSCMPRFDSDAFFNALINDAREDGDALDGARLMEKARDFALERLTAVARQ